MKRIRPDFYNEFHCIADSCTITCCQEWKIAVDPDTNQKWKKVSAPADVPEQKKNLSAYTEKKTVSGSFSLTQTIAAPFFPRTDFAGLLLLTMIKSCPKPVLRFQEKFTGFPVISRKR